MTVSEFSQSIGLWNSRTLHEMIESSIVKTKDIKNFRTSRIDTCITANEIDEFHKQFITIAILARERGESPQAVSGRLRKRGIQPLTVEGVLYKGVYRRKDLAE